jgi:hypothetical protein
MNVMAQFAVLTLTTIFAGVLAFGMAWAFLLAAFHLMRPAAVRISRTSASRVSKGFDSDCAGHAGCGAAACAQR